MMATSTPGDNAGAGAPATTSTKRVGASDTSADSPAQVAAEVKEQAVVFIGDADVRKITKADWASLEIDQGVTEWSAKNKFAIPVADLAPEAVKYLDETDGFVVKDA